MKGKGIMNKNEKNLTHRICSRMVICMAILAAIGFGTVTRLLDRKSVV